MQNFNNNLNKITYKTIIIFALLILTMATSVVLTFFYGSLTTDWLKFVILGFTAVLFTAFLITYLKNLNFTYKLLFVSVFTLCVVWIAYLLLKNYGVLALLESVDETKAFVESTGNYGRIIFVFIQFVQVALIPIPAFITIAAGVTVFGFFEAFILSTIGIILGSLFAFFVWGRLFGYPMVKWIAGKEATDKYRDLMNKKGKYLFALMILMPIFPDDILCAVAGITTMSGKFFTISTILLRPITTLAICLFSGGSIIPYSGWGLIAWPIVLAIMAVIFVWTYKNTEKIENKIINMFNFKKS